MSNIEKEIRTQQTSQADKNYEANLERLKQDQAFVRAKYSRVIVFQARIFWEQKDYKSVELTLEASYDICHESQVFRTNLAHSIYMQGVSRYQDAVNKYEGLLRDFSLAKNLLKAETIVLANLCVCYIVLK